jgi:hypothetical protein
MDATEIAADAARAVETLNPLHALHLASLKAVAWIGALALGVGLVLGVAGGSWVAHAKDAAQIATLKLAAATLQSNTLDAALQREQAARSAADLAQAQLAAVLSAYDTVSQEKTHAIAHATTGSACLGDRALRVLDGATGLRLAAVPGAASGPAADDGPAAADPGAPGDFEATSAYSLVATDTEVAGWMLTAGRMYETCRARLNALVGYLNPAASAEPALPGRSLRPLGGSGAAAAGGSK